jgi:hypothetical protein
VLAHDGGCGSANKMMIVSQGNAKLKHSNTTRQQKNGKTIPHERAQYQHTAEKDKGNRI